jgi:ABC-type nickel/cobalt efflux system permease component RcnA
MNRLQRVGVVTGIIAAVLLLPSVAMAHPLGNATVNRADIIVVGTDRINITHLLDLAEIPTVAAMPRLDSDDNGTVAASEMSDYVGEVCRTDAADSALTINGRRSTLTVTRATGELIPGQAGLQILRISCDWQTPVDLSGETSIDYEAAGLSAAGWREVVAAGDRTTISNSDVPAVSPSTGLSNYPQDLLSAPPVVEAASFTVATGGPALSQSPVVTGTGEGVSSPGLADRTTRWLGELADRATSPLGAVLALVVAAAVGAFHALTPGHGKTAVAFAIAGQERSRRAALLVGATVTATHTGSVLVLGALVASTTAFAPASLYPWLSVFSGLLVVAVGAALLRRALTGQRGHVHLGSGRHDHHHAHDHPRPHGHHHHEALQPVNVAVLERPTAVHVHDGEHARATDHPHGTSSTHVTNRRTLAALGIAGGVVPSPSALLVLLGTAAAGRAWWGVALVVAFGLGMALTLGAAGLLAWRVGEHVRQWAALRQHHGAVRLASALPVVAASAVCGAGLLVVARSVVPIL